MDPACGVWPAPLIADGDPPLPASCDTVVDISSGMNGTTMYAGESFRSYRDQHSLPITLFVQVRNFRAYELGKVIILFIRVIVVSGATEDHRHAQMF